MRRLWSTLALLVVLLGLGGYIYYGMKPSNDTASKNEKLFAGVESDQIEELKVKSEAGDVTTVKKESGAWKMVAPVTAPASDSDVSSITSALNALEIERVVDENPADLKDFGLDQPRIDIEFKSAGGKPSGRLRVGSKTATGASLYALKNDDKRVLLIPQYQETSLNKSTFDLRDKTILKVERDKVDGADILVDGKTVELAKSGEDWKLTKPIAARADNSAVDGLIARVQTAQMKSVVTSAPTPADLKKYRLDKPSTVVNLHLGSARASLQLGGKAEGDAVYARDASKPDVFTIENSLADDLKKGADDYRRKDLFEMRAFNATHVEITRGSQTITFERVKSDKPDQPDTWKRLAPTPGEPERQKVEDLLAGLADIRATSFVDSKTKTGLDSPAMIVAVKFDDGKKEERVSFGKNGSDVYASRPDDPGVAKIEPSKFDDAMKALDELAK